MTALRARSLADQWAADAYQLGHDDGEGRTGWVAANRPGKRFGVPPTPLCGSWPGDLTVHDLYVEVGVSVWADPSGQVRAAYKAGFAHGYRNDVHAAQRPHRMRGNA